MTISYRVERTRNRHSRAVIQDDTIVIRLARRLSENEERRHIENLVRRMAKMLMREQVRPRIDPFVPVKPHEADDVKGLVDAINASTMSVRITGTRLKPMRSQWGSCSSSGKITLNTALLQLPRELLKYVIIHELAHRVHQNHSKQFWDLVATFCPDFKELRKTLRHYRLR